MIRKTWIATLLLIPLFASMSQAADTTTTTGTAAVTGVSSGWIAVEAPLTGDDNHNGYALFEMGTSAGGPFSTSGAWGYVWNPGTSEWRTEVFGRGLVLPGSTYYIRVTWADPDGVSGPNPQIVGPLTTPASSPNAVTPGAVSAEARDEEIFVSVPISDDANMSSFGTVDVATSPGGPWTRKCGSTFENNLPFQPKRCRIRSLTPGTDYWVQVTLYDGDGVSGPNPQVVGPIRYDGLQNLALGRPVTADPGWGCCPSPSHLVDGRIQYDAWYYGFAWTGGTSSWAGPAGIKQATVDLGAPTPFDRAAVWYHDPGAVPRVWSFQVSDDGASWTGVHAESSPVCRGETIEMPGAWSFPACAHDATFPRVTARYFRYSFDDRTLFRGLHGWAVEIEVFDTAGGNEPPVADAGPDRTVPAAADGCLADVTLDGTASSDPDGDALTWSWSGPFGTAAGATPTVTLPLGTHAITLTVDDGGGESAADEVLVTVLDAAGPAIASVQPSPGLLWPPNHKLRPVEVTVTAADACDAAPPVCRVTAVISDEPVNGTGDGDTAPDWLITGDLTVRLRAERSGSGDGRVYTLETVCEDEAGNASTATAAVVVPHDLD